LVEHAEGGAGRATPPHRSTTEPLLAPAAAQASSVGTTTQGGWGWWDAAIWGGALLGLALLGFFGDLVFGAVIFGIATVVPRPPSLPPVA
jgi:predicted lipid-binding transport protein (Tim44 family)